MGTNKTTALVSIQKDEKAGNFESVNAVVNLYELRYISPPNKSATG